MLVLDFLVHRS